MAESSEHILVCLSSAPSNERIVRTAARMAKAFDCQFTALFVETPDFHAQTAENKRRLQENSSLAERLGAHIETAYGDDVPYQISEFARLSGVTSIVLGSSVVTRKHLLRKPTLTEQLIAYAPGIDIHIIPDYSTDANYRARRSRANQKLDILSNVVKSISVLLGATALSLIFYKLGFTNANIIMVYILGVLLTSVVTTNQIYSLISSVASVFIFNYLFTSPRFTLTAYETGYPVTFVVMFLTAFITGTFAMRYKEQAKQSARIAYRTRILFDTDQLLSRAENKDEILNAAAAQMIKLLGRNMVIFEVNKGELSAPRLFRAGPDAGKSKEACQDAENQIGYDIQAEMPVVKWVMEHNHSAGAATDTMSDAHYLYLALRVNERVYGVVGIEAEDNPLDASDHGILLSILGECALALENEKNAREKEAAMVMAENERLRANLLRTISHDLRTPLTTISGNASNLLSNGSSFDEETKRQLYSDIYDDSMWLINLVENLLSATRIEEGRMTLRTTTELLSDIVEEAMHHISRKAAGHKLSVEYEDDLMLVQADAKLVVQVITNIVDNAVKYTPPGSSIRISTRRLEAAGQDEIDGYERISGKKNKAADKNGNTGKHAAMAEICIADNGGGIPDEEKTRIFDKFYCGENRIADNRRSLGLGLYLCRAIVEAHGGTIRVTDNQPRGAVFAFTLPLKEVTLHEQDHDTCG